MSAIPTSDMPGYKNLHDRVCSALDTCQELKAVEFKQSATWNSLKLNLIRTIIAMGNLRDGGIIVIGASECDKRWELTGIDDAHLQTYDVDEIYDAVNKYASPPATIEIVLVTYSNTKNFLAIQVHEFSERPFVCKKNGPNESKELRAGELYIRKAAGKPETTKVTSSEDMHDLLELAAEKGARRILETAYRIGLTVSATDNQKFDEELEGL